MNLGFAHQDPDCWLPRSLSPHALHGVLCNSSVWLTSLFWFLQYTSLYMYGCRVIFVVIRRCFEKYKVGNLSLKFNVLPFEFKKEARCVTRIWVYTLVLEWWGGSIPSSLCWAFGSSWMYQLDSSIKNSMLATQVCLELLSAALSVANTFVSFKCFFS